MMHFIEIFFFQQFFISTLRLLCNYDSLIELVFELTNLIFQFFAFLIFGWNFLYVLVDRPFLHALIPFLLEIAKSLAHFMFDEKISKEKVDRLSLIFL